MDIFVFTNPTAETLMEQGEYIDKITSKTWIERFRDAGEFTLVAPVSSGIKEKLPLGSFISHTDSTEIMIVENHEINEDSTSSTEPDITVTGRSLETFLENRIVGANIFLPFSGTVGDKTFDADWTWNQAVALISDGILSSSLVDSNFVVPYIEVISYTPGISGGTNAARSFPIGTTYAALTNLLAIDNLGIRTVRPVSGSDGNTKLVVHNGIDKTSDIVFSFNSGQVLTADYLWSNKTFKNSALVYGKWVIVSVNPSAVGYDRKMMLVDASDLDNALTEVPTGDALSYLEVAMTLRGTEALNSQTNVEISKVEISKDGTRYRNMDGTFFEYRKDFNLGDFVTVQGDYHTTATMQVTEYVEIEDNTGESGYPTLIIT